MPPTAQSLSVSKHVCDFFRTSTFDFSKEELDDEVRLTSLKLLPALKVFVDRLGHRSLHVRGDGAQKANPALLGGLFFYPDLAVVEFERKHLALEVKVLRAADQNEALAKALGQTLIYGQCGYATSGTVLIAAEPLGGLASALAQMQVSNDSTMWHVVLNWQLKENI